MEITHYFEFMLTLMAMHNYASYADLWLYYFSVRCKGLMYAQVTHKNPLFVNCLFVICMVQAAGRAEHRFMTYKEYTSIDCTFLLY